MVNPVRRTQRCEILCARVGGYLAGRRRRKRSNKTGSRSLRGRRFVIAKDLASKAIPFAKLPESDWSGGIATLNGGGDTMMLGGHFDFSGAHTEMLLGAMPSIVCLRDENDKAGLCWALERMRQELFGSQPGANLVVQHLAYLMLVQALRLYLSHGIGRGVGWLFALGDPKIAAAIGAIQQIQARAGPCRCLPKRQGCHARSLLLGSRRYPDLRRSIT